MKFAYGKARESMTTSSSHTVISFFFNARGEGLEKSVEGMYRSLLFKILQQIPELQLNTGGLVLSEPMKWHVEVLRELFEKTILSLGSRQLTCFIDALDECPLREVQDLVRDFQQLGKQAEKAGISFFVCFSSRHYPNVVIKDAAEMVLEKRPEHDTDIRTFIQEELEIGNGPVVEEIRDGMIEKANGVFLWVVLVVRILNEEFSDGMIHKLRQRLEELPSDLHALFRDILARDSKNVDELVLCIQWVLLARPSLSREELYFAILAGAEGEVKPWDKDVATFDVIERFLISSSKGLTEVTKDRKNRAPMRVQFIHETVRDFFLKDNGLATIKADLENNFIGKSHEMLMKCCLTQMGVEVSETGARILHDSDLLTPSSPSRDLLLDRYPFLLYASRNMLVHAELSHYHGISQKSVIAHFPLKNWIISLHNKLESQELQYSSNARWLYVLADRNCSTLLHDELGRCNDTTSLYFGTKERFGCPLGAAIAHGYEEPIRLLVSAAARYNSSDPEVDQHSIKNATRLILKPKEQLRTKIKTVTNIFELAWSVRAYAFLPILLATAKIDPPKKWRLIKNAAQTNIFNAAMDDREDIIRLGLRIGMPVNPSVFYQVMKEGGEHRAEAFLRVLEENGVSATEIDNHRRMALVYACREGQRKLIGKLVNPSTTGRNPVDCNSEIHGMTLLIIAVDEQNLEVVEELFKSPDILPNLASKKSEGQTAIHRAVITENIEILRFLLAQETVHCNAQDDEGNTALHLAVLKEQNTNLEIIRELLGSGRNDFNPNILNNGKLAPIHIAARGRPVEILKELLKWESVDPNLGPPGVPYPIILCVNRIDTAFLKAILSREGVSIDSGSSITGPPTGSSALHRAVHSGVSEMVRLVLSAKPKDCEDPSATGATVFVTACSAGRLEIVKMLLEYAPNVKKDVIGFKGRNALHYTVRAENDPIDLARFLVEELHFDVNAVDDYGTTALMLAASMGNMAIVKFLVEDCGVDPAVKDNEGKGALEHIPIRRGKFSTHNDVRALLESLEEREPVGQTEDLEALATAPVSPQQE